MAFDVEFVIVGIGKTAKFIDELPGEWRLRTNQRLSGWGEELTAIAQSLSPEDKLRGIDRRRRPRSEGLAQQWEWEIDGDNLNVGNVDPKMQFIIFPTSGGATIEPKEANFLLFFDTSGRPHRREMVTKGATSGQPVHEWALETFDLNSHVSQLADTLVFK